MPIMRTGLLLAALTAIFMTAGYLLGGAGGMLVALLLAGGMNLFAWWNSGAMVLRMHGAQEIEQRSAPALIGIVRQLAARADLPMPRVYIMDNPQPNAFATGRNPANAAVAVTTGLLERLTQEELAGVLAHELAHIKHRDTLTMSVTATLAGALGMLGNFAFMFGGMGGSRRDNPLGVVGVLLAAVLAPIAAMLVQFAISRSREYEADRIGAGICGHPLWLAAALGKLGRAAAVIPNAQAEQSPATAHLFIVNPLRGGGVAGLFATHPPIEERMLRLRNMVGKPTSPSPWA